MTVEEAIRTFLLTRGAVTLITSTIRPDELSEGDTLPAILINLEEEEPQNDLDGLGGLVEATVVISAISTSKRQARQIAEAIRTNNTQPGTGLAGYNGAAGDLHMNAMLSSRSSGYVPEEDGSDSGLHSVESIYSVWFSETT